MTRLLSMTVFVVLAAVLYFLPDPAPARLAALESDSLLREPVADLAQAGGPLWQALAGSSAATRPDERTLVLLLGETRVDGESSAVVRQSIRRGLRALTADGEGWDELTLEGVDEPVPGGADFAVTIEDGALRLTVTPPGGAALSAAKPWTPPNRGCLFPPILAILLAILFRRPVLALFTGVLAGAIIERFSAGEGVLASATTGIPNVFSVYLWNELKKSDRAYLILFVIFMLGMVGVITRAGGIRGLMDRIARVATNAKHTQIATWLMGLAVFFDDYANTILVGSTMRPLTDRFKVAREKLAYIVDSTAAPVAGLSIFSTWIAFEVSTFSAQLPDVGLSAGDGYGIFIQTLPYRFYCIFTLFFVGMLVLTGRDMGPMLTAERRARRGRVLRDGAKPMVDDKATELQPADGIRPRMFVALLPLFAFIGVTLFEIARVGGAFSGELDLFTLSGLAQVLYDGSGSKPLMVGSAVGLVLAALLALMAGLRGEILGAAWAALRSMGIAIVILYLAWMIGGVCSALGTASYLTVLLGDTIQPAILPAVLFVLSGVVAFSTGSSWGTMSILLPLVVGLSFNLGEASELGGHALMILSIGAVLEGAIFGDHCSPISDTTVMSSIASASDHIDHVRTQAPYALLTMTVSLVAGYLPATYLGLNPFVGIAFGLALLFGILILFGRTAEQEPATGTVPATQP